MIDAHTQSETLHIVCCVPPHEARADDPHYATFNRTRDRMVKAGLLKCWIDNADCAGDIELHHDKVEFSLQQGVDLSRFAEAFPEFSGKSDDEFREWIEGPGNLLALCRIHHIGVLGVHVLPYPVWEPQKFWKAGMAVPARLVPASGHDPASDGACPAAASAP